MSVVENNNNCHEIIVEVNYQEKGDTGKSAYEFAVEQGFVGTEEEWIESLKQPALDAAQEAIDASETANQAAQNADDKANLANTAANNADSSAQNADDKAQLANQASIDADNAANRANTAAEDTEEATQDAITATGNANQAAENVPVIGTISPTDPEPTKNGMYIPTVTQNEAGTDIVYPNAGGLTVNTAEGGEDYGMGVQLIKNGAVWVKNSYPLPIQDLTATAGTVNYNDINLV